MAPPLVGAAVSAVVAGSWVAGSAGLIIGFSLPTFAGSLVLSGISSVLTQKSKPSTSSLKSSSSLSSNLTQQFKQPTPPRRMVFGEQRVSGPIAYIGSSGDNEYLHYVIMLASHEVDSIPEIWINSDSIGPDELDSNGDIISTACGGKYYKNGTPYIRIKKFLGSPTQAACSDLMSAFPSWTSAHRLRGIAYIYVRLKASSDIFQSNIPNISAWVRGYKCYDPRILATAWSNNPMLVARAYMTDSDLGLGVNTANFNSSYLTAGANTCEEFVSTASVVHTISSLDTSTEIISVNGTTLLFQTGDRVQVTTSGSLPGGISASTNYYIIVQQRANTPRIKLAATYAGALAGSAINLTSSGSGTHTITKNAEPRYTCGGVIETTQDPNKAIEDILSSMSGNALYAGGLWTMRAGAYDTPTLSFDESDLISAYQVQTRTSRKDRFNSVHGTYVSPINNGQPSDYPTVKNDTYAAEDGSVIETNFDLPFTQRPHTAQRLAKIALEKSRQEIIFSARFKLTAFKCQVGDNVLLSITRMGWTNKAFEVIEWSYNEELRDNVAVPFIEMKLKETASTVYDWNSGEETAVDPAPNSTLPNPFTVAAITGFSADSEKVLTQTGDYVYKVLAHWTAVTDQFVLNGGRIEVEFKKSTDTTWRPTYNVSPDFDFCEVTLAAQLNTQYDIRIRAVNYLGAKSSYTTILGYTVGSSGGVGTTGDWGNWTDSVGTTNNWTNWTDSVGTTNDWGYYS